MISDKTVSFTIDPRENINSTKDLLSAIFDPRDPTPGHKLWYRGLPDCEFQLTPSVGREQRYAGQCLKFSRGQERVLLNRFRKRAYPYIGRVLNAGEAIFLARHHGLPTRLLDWTANALFALYFSCVGDRKEDQKKSGRVWAMRRRKGTEEHEIDAFEFANRGESAVFKPGDAIKIIYPFYNSPRLVAQDGGFTFHSRPERSIESYKDEPFKAQNLDVGELYYWDIPTDKKANIVKELSELGITQRALFPDLDGVARSIWEMEVLWRGDPE